MREKPEEPRKYPIIIKPSPKALHANYVKAGAVVLLLVTMAIPLGLMSLFAMVLAIGIALLPILAILAATLYLRYLRIKNTTYRLYPKKLECESYALRFLGVHNSVVNIGELREIHAYSNSYLDIWFFDCGGVVLTVSGDVPDFRIADVYMPRNVQATIERVCFADDVALKVLHQFASPDALPGIDTDQRWVMLEHTAPAEGINARRTPSGPFCHAEA